MSESDLSVLPSNTVLGIHIFSHYNATKALLTKSELPLTQIHIGCANVVQLMQKKKN